MINTAETQPPLGIRSGKINTSETRAPGDGTPQPLSKGETVGSGYTVRLPLSRQGKQADLYLAEKDGRKWALKLWHGGYQPPEELRLTLERINHPNILRIAESGLHRGYYYQVSEYYPDGTLEDQGALPASEIARVIVPSINEGLRELHRQGLIHCDIKPSNLFYDRTQGRAVIGDCGVSKFANPDGPLIGQIRGTPEYAPPVRGSFGNEAVSPAYDYGSFGLVLCRAVLGRSLFAGRSVEEIAESWRYGIQLPERIEGRIGTLIRGLLLRDEDHRWGYREVKRWCEGEFISVHSARSSASESKPRVIPLIFGTFGGEILSVSSLHQLANAVKQHWDQARNIVRKLELADFVYQFDRDNDLRQQVIALRNDRDTDAAVYKLLNTIEDDWQSIFYCGVDYGSLGNLVDRLSGSPADPLALKFLNSGLLILYLRKNGAPQDQVARLEQLVNSHRPDDLTTIATVCYALKGERQLNIFGQTVEDLDQLVPVLSRRSIPEIDRMLQDARFIAWMNRLGYTKEMQQMNKIRPVGASSSAAGSK